MKTIDLAPIHEDESDFESIEKRILSLFLREIYTPLPAELGESVALIKNSNSAIEEAVLSGRIAFYKGRFTGTFGSKISKELGKLGATWDRTQGSWKIPQSKLPITIRAVIARSESKFSSTISRIISKLDKLIPEEIAGRLDLSALFDKTLWKVEGKLKSQLKAISVQSQLTAEEAIKISKRYSENMSLYIKDFTEVEILKLREKIKENTFGGVRYESLVKTIQKSYEVSVNKAKFLARQETSLMLSNYKQSRYESAGSKEYTWRTVKGTSAHPVRHMHHILDGTVHLWTNPPITSEDGRRNHPGQDYNCRCSAIARIKF